MKIIENNKLDTNVINQLDTDSSGEFVVTLEESASALTQGVSGPKLEAGMNKYTPV